MLSYKFHKKASKWQNRDLLLVPNVLFMPQFLETRPYWKFCISNVEKRDLSHIYCILNCIISATGKFYTQYASRKLLLSTTMWCRTAVVVTKVSVERLYLYTTVNCSFPFDILSSLHSWWITFSCQRTASSLAQKIACNLLGVKSFQRLIIFLTDR